MTIQVRIHGYDPTEGQEMIYRALFKKEDAIHLLKDLYDNHQLPVFGDNWSIEKNEEKPTWHYVLDVDQQAFLLEEYDDANATDTNRITRLKSTKSTNKLMSVPMTLSAPPISFSEAITQILLECNSI